MKVSELIEELQGLDPNMDIYLQKDAEGNGYEPLRVADPTCIVREEGGYGEFEVYSDSYSADEADMSEEEWAEVKAGPRCLVLSP